MTRLSISHAPWLAEAILQSLAVLFERAGHPFYFVGGCVRDALLHRDVGDIDACTSLTPEAVTALLSASSIRVIPTGLSHGTVTALVGNRAIQITTLRKDTACDGRHAEVEYTDNLAEDAARRDFTMNALYCDKAGSIIDFYNGISDAENGMIRFIGNPEDRIREDALRILRYFRFLATHGTHAPEENALSACHCLAPMIESLSGERIKTEMLKLLAADNPLGAIQAMQGSVIQHLIPSLLHMDGLQDVLSAEKSLGIQATSLTRLAAILRSTEFPSEAAEALSDRWRLSGADAQLLKKLTTQEVLPAGATESLLKVLLRALGKETFEAMALLSWQSHTEDLCKEALHLAQHWQIPVFPVGGEDLIAIGWQEGKALGEKLNMLEAIWESQNYQPDKATLLALAGEANPQ